MNISTTKGILKRIHRYTSYMSTVHQYGTSMLIHDITDWNITTLHIHYLCSFLLGFSLFCAQDTREMERKGERERERMGVYFFETLQDDHYESYNTWGINVHFLIITRSTQNQKTLSSFFPFSFHLIVHVTIILSILV